ncbi:MAG: TenA family protein [Flavobacteriales bacterium]
MKNAMNWSEKAWEAIAPIYEKILVHPFIEELKAGSLAEEKFKCYVQQDSLYLADFAKVLAAIASKLDKSEHRQTYLGFALETISVENALHETFFQKRNINPLVEQSPWCLSYTSFLRAQLVDQPVEIAMAAVLPCFWIYKKVGDYIVQTQTPIENKYRDWIDTYGGAAFALSVGKAIRITDEIAADCSMRRQRQMIDAFITAAKMEWLFWAGAYQQAEWKI